MGESPYGTKRGWQWYEDAAQAKKAARVARMAKAADWHYISKITGTMPAPPAIFVAAPAIVPVNFV